MGIVILAGFVALGYFGTRLARRGMHARHLYAGGFALGDRWRWPRIFLRLPGSYLWWGLYGLGSAVNVLGFTVLNEGFGSELAGRTQHDAEPPDVRRQLPRAMGHRARRRIGGHAFGYDTAAGLRLAFMLVLGGNVLTFAWFLHGWRRHAPLTWRTT